VENSVGIVTVISPIVGYQKAAEVAKRAMKTGRSVKEVILEEHLIEPEKLDQLLNPVSMTEPGHIRKKQIRNHKIRRSRRTVCGRKNNIINA
jgi:aspartate ammonia-lyase